MKKRIYILIGIVLMILLIIFNFNEEEGTITTSYQIEESDNSVFVFYCKEDVMYGVSLPSNTNNKYDLIYEAYDYLTMSKNKAPYGYYSYLSNSSKLLSYKIKNDELTLCFDEDFLLYHRGYEKEVLAALYETYHMQGYQRIMLMINDVLLEELNGIKLDGDYSNESNIKVIDSLTSSIKIYEYLSEDLLTYKSIYVECEDKISYIIKQLVTDSNILVNEENIIITINDYQDINLLKKSLEKSLEGYTITLKIA